MHIEIYISDIILSESTVVNLDLLGLHVTGVMKNGSFPQIQNRHGANGLFLAFYRFDSLMGICYFLIIKPNK